MHSRTWDRASAKVKSSGTLIAYPIWSWFENPVEVLDAEDLREVGLAIVGGTPGIVVVQAWRAVW